VYCDVTQVLSIMTALSYRSHMSSSLATDPQLLNIAVACCVSR